MLNLSLQQVLGDNAIQTEVDLIIKKSDLPLLSSNNPESILVALILKLNAIYQGQIDEITTESGESLTYDNQDLYLKLNSFYWKKQFISGFIRHDFIIDIYQPDPNLNYPELDVNQL